MFFDKLKSVIKTPEIEFLCAKEDFGVIPKPYPARKNMPNWYKELPQYIENQKTFDTPTLKRCPPFLDALCLGWIIPLAADVQFKTNDDSSHVEYKSLFYKQMVDNHTMQQISTERCLNPDHPKPPLKWRNWWAIKVPKGYSLLFVPPLNRQEPRFTCYSGLVDDGYFEYINFPFFFNLKNFVGIIPAGTPLMQVIPIKRDTIIKDGTVGPFNDKHVKEYEKTKKRYSVHNSMYRDFIWERK